MPALLAVLRLLDVVGLYVKPVAVAEVDDVDEVDEVGVVVACVAVLVFAGASAEF